MVKQPFDRVGTAGIEAVLHFADLLGDVDVDRAVLRRAGREQAAHGQFRYRAQRMQGDADT